MTRGTVEKLKTGFFAYSGTPPEIGYTLESAFRQIESTGASLNIKSWKSMDVVGQFIAEEVLSSIENAEIFLADISVLNFNVTYEIGYAIGKRKPIILVKNRSLREASPSIRDVGIFDTIGYEKYENSQELFSIITNLKNISQLNI